MAHNFTNIDFETAKAGGVVPFGSSETFEPDGWSWGLDGILWSWFRIDSTFASGDVSEAIERFEAAWSTNEGFVFAFADPYDPLELEQAQWNTGALATAFEGFEVEWSTNESFSFTIGNTAAASFDTAPESFEDFEDEWGGYDLAMGSVSFASFDTAPESFEDFEDEWGGYDLAMGSVSFASFDNGSAEAFEDFEEVWSYVFDVAITSVAAGEYRITIAGEDAIYTASGGESTSTIATQLAAAANLIRFETEVDATPSGSSVLLAASSLPASEFALSVAGPNPGTMTVSRAPYVNTYWTQTGRLE